MSPPLTLWRYRLALEPSRDHRDNRHGVTFAGLRSAYLLTVDEVAHGWKVPPLTIARLEAGEFRFPAAADEQAAVSQLWLWSHERNERKDLYEGWPTPREPAHVPKKRK